MMSAARLAHARLGNQWRGDCPAGDDRRVKTAFVPGLELAGRYYAEVVRPILDRRFGGLEHSAALIGSGSEVLGFDSARSTDHNWGPRCLVFVAGPADGELADAGRAEEIGAVLAAELPEKFLGWPTRFPDVTAPGWPVRHWVEVAELGSWLDARLGFDPRLRVGLADWLATPTQLLAEITGGAVFHDGLGDRGSACVPRRPGWLGGLEDVRAALAWYPDDLWRYVLACQWARIGQEEAFPGRCAEAGDELGSAVVAARLVRDLMRLALLMRRRYPPYSKWLGTAFSALEGADELRARLAGVLSAHSWPEREDQLSAAFEESARFHNGLGLAAAVDPSTRPFHDRPYRVIGATRLVDALKDSIGDEDVRRLAMTGAVDQFVDSTDAIGERRLLRAAIAAQLGG